MNNILDLGCGDGKVLKEFANKYHKKNLSVINFIKSIYSKNKLIPLHEPRFAENEKKYLSECIDSTFVSSVGKFGTKFFAS